VRRSAYSGRASVTSAAMTTDGTRASHADSRLPARPPSRAMSGTSAAPLCSGGAQPRALAP